MALQGTYIFYSTMTNISKMRSNVGPAERNRVLMSWYVWFLGEFFFWQNDEYVAYSDVFAISKVGEETKFLNGNHSVKNPSLGLG